MATHTRTFVCVPIMCEDIEQSMRESVLASELGADLVEFRVDGLFDPENAETGVREITALVERCPVPAIVTCRPAGEGGEYEGDDASRLALYGALIASDHPPRYVDLEIETIDRGGCEGLLAALGGDDAPTSLIVSTHDFEGRPEDLSKRLLEMRSVEAARVIKIAFRARSLRDNLELFEILAHRDRPTIALGMGEHGLLSRALAPKFGGFLTFASIRDQSATAPGQPTVMELLDLYRFRSIGKETRVYGVVGWPVAHSRSPEIHNKAFGEHGIDGVYFPMPVPPEWEHFKATVGELVASGPLDLGGLSVTLPHKAHAVRLARELGWAIDETARLAGAANTVVVQRDGSVRVTNTDGLAARACLEETANGSLAGRRVAVIGAGGVARGIVAALLDSGAQITVHNRTESNGAALADELRAHATQGTTVGSAGLDAIDGDVLINATPVGMEGGGAENESPIDEKIAAGLSDGSVFMDTVYTPVDTPFLRLARENGFHSIDGRAMFLRQANMQFEAWTGMRNALGLLEKQ